MLFCASRYWPSAGPYAPLISTPVAIVSGATSLRGMATLSGGMRGASATVFILGRISTSVRELDRCVGDSLASV